MSLTFRYSGEKKKTLLFHSSSLLSPFILGQLNSGELKEAEPSPSTPPSLVQPPSLHLYLVTQTGISPHSSLQCPRCVTHAAHMLNIEFKSSWVICDFVMGVFLELPPPHISVHFCTFVVNLSPCRQINKNKGHWKGWRGRKMSLSSLEEDQSSAKHETVGD